MISVVIPLYNKASFVSKTITSVLEQTYSDFEVIVVNDGSTDRSLALVQEHSDPRIRVISISHSGVSDARNRGIKEAAYNWVAFLDADDRWAPTFLAEIFKTINEYPENSIFASGRTRLFSSYAERYEHTYLPKDGSTTLINYFKVISATLPPINASNAVIRKSLFDDKGSFRSNQTNHEDHDLWMRLTVDEPVVFVNKPLSVYDKSVVGSQSTKPLQATSLLQYLKTMIEVKDRLTTEEQAYFNRYSKRFIVFTYLKNERYFSKREAKLIREQAKPLLSRLLQLMLDANRFLYFTDLYNVIKPML